MNYLKVVFRNIKVTLLMGEEPSLLLELPALLIGEEPLAGEEGFEPPMTGPKPVALPLGHSPTKDN